MKSARHLPSCRQDALWGRLLARLADGHWHALVECTRGGSTGAIPLRRALRDYARRGVPLQFDLARGVRLRSKVTPLASRNPRTRVATCFETDSTNARLLQVLHAGYPDIGALAAEQQTQGRGRHARRWITPLGGGIALSVACPYAHLPAGRMPAALPLRVGVALARACTRLGVRGVCLKWPNDLMLQGRKLGGILIEGGAKGLVIGVGLNHAFPARWRGRVDQPLISLRDVLGARTPARSRVLNVLFDALMTVRHGADTGWQEYFERHDVLAGREIRISASAGDLGEVREGVALGVTEEGALRVLTPDGERLCHAGEVSVRLGT